MNHASNFGYSIEGQLPAASKPLIAAEGIKKTILDLRAAARMRGQEADEAFLKHSDPRAVQGGAICEEASRWRELARTLTEAARKCDVLTDCGE